MQGIPAEGKHMRLLKRATFIALVVSLALHGGALIALALWDASYWAGRINLPPIVIAKIHVNEKPHAEVVPPLPESAQEAAPAAEPDVPPPVAERNLDLPPEIRAVESLHEIKLGDPDGKGYGINSADGELTMHAREGDEDQAFLSRDERGPGSTWNLPSLSLKPEGARPGPQEAPGAGDEPAKVAWLGPPESDMTPLPVIHARAAERTRAAQLGSDPMFRGAQPDSTTRPVPAESIETAHLGNPAPVGAGGGGGGATPSADPARMSDSESDAFAKIGSFEFRDGRVDAQCGLKIRTVRPRLGPKGQLDLVQLHCPPVPCIFRADRAGRIVNVTIAHPTGSNEVDLPIQVAAWQWELAEPFKDKSGRPIPVEFQVTFTWR